MSDLDGIDIVPGPSAEQLNERQLMDYRHEGVQCLEWLLAFGKEPEKARGASASPARSTLSRSDVRS